MVLFEGIPLWVWIIFIVIIVSMIIFTAINIIAMTLIYSTMSKVLYNKTTVGALSKLTKTLI